MARYTPQFVAHIRHRYEETDDTLAVIALDCRISERTVNRMRDREGWKRRSDREPQGLTPAMRLLDEATALLGAPAAETVDGLSAHSRTRVQPSAGPSTGSSGNPVVPDEQATAEEPGPRVCGDERPDGGDGESAIDRIERLVEKEIAAEEAVRARLGSLSRTPADAERAARTLATLTQTLHALARLRCGQAPDVGSDDDMPRDIDEFRRDLARRIDAFVASRTGGGHAPGGAGPAAVDEAR